MEKRSDLNWKEIAEWLKRGRVRIKPAVILCLIVLMGLSAEATWASEKVTIGAVENMTLLPWGVTIPARIDTGAATSSLDVCDLVVRQKMVTFSLPERCGGKELRLPLIGWRRVQSTTGTHRRRPVVEMEVCFGPKRLRAQFTLNDRSQMEYPMLVGRQVLAGNFLVDVSQSNTQPPNCPVEKTP